MPPGASLDFDIESFVDMNPADFRLRSTVPAGLDFTGDAEFHLRVLLPNDNILSDRVYDLRQVASGTDPATGRNRIDFALRPADESTFHLQQSALLSSLVAGFVNLQSDQTSLGICQRRTSGPLLGHVTMDWRDSGRDLTIASITVSTKSLVDGLHGGLELCLH
ncbi:hypothetical protein [Pseudoruegeria sp. SK021]|uniref:hypothetical protein n=1 Tax=Pseudoruegeria sp. SK021 TaxID=1933035 RepID=UPI00111C2CE4|nr:hypothetical protein [Pseudoruegeria sp. SK021]